MTDAVDSSAESIHNQRVVDKIDALSTKKQTSSTHSKPSESTGIEAPWSLQTRIK